jgi:Na+/H+-dicarboxylate symporter
MRTRGFWVLGALLVGALVGYGLSSFTSAAVLDSVLTYGLDPIGQIFLRLLFMIVVPLVFCSLATGIANLGSGPMLGRMGVQLAIFYTSTTMLAILTGYALVQWIGPGQGADLAQMESMRAELLSSVSHLTEKTRSVSDNLWPGLVTMVIPRNIIQSLAQGEMLAILFAAIFSGVGLLKIGESGRTLVLGVLQAISDVCLWAMTQIMRLAPVAVAALVASAVARFGGGVLVHVLTYVGVVVAGFLIHALVSYPIIIRVVLKRSPWDFFRRAAPALVTAFSTSSSNATIPMSLKTMEENFGVPKKIAAFSIPLGATVNMDGTALFEIVAAVFIAQLFGVVLGPLAVVTLILLVLLTSIGIAGVPGGSIPLLMSAMAVVGVPPEGIALILGVDRLLDMGRTTLNVLGDLVATLYLKQKHPNLS